MTDPARTYTELRASTAELLGYDLDQLGSVESLRLDLTSLLRLQIDHLSGQALAGDSINMDTLGSCVQLLQKLLPASVTQAPAIVENYDDDVREFAAHVQGLIKGRRQQMAFDPDKAFADFEAELKAAIAEHCVEPKRTPHERLQQELELLR
jgi:hypothetical protein